jgi:hypothetical protein
MREPIRDLRVAGIALVAALSFALAGLVPSPARGASTTLRTGFLDFGVMGLEQDERAAWLQRATSVGASVMRIDLIWYAVSPIRPPEGAASDPSWPGYTFAAYDAQIKSAAAAGMTVLLDVSRAPTWAEGAGKPKNIPGVPGNWKPDVAAYGKFLTAVARRYSGNTPDPVAPGTMLPKITDFQIWNEPNLGLYLAPQYEAGRPFAPVRWRELVNAGYASVKAVQPDANVVAAGLAPFGDPASPTAQRTRPVAFLRSALCLDERLQKTCDDVMLANTFSLHPYAVARPSQHARDPDDATVPDYNRIATVLTAAWSQKTVGPGMPKSWATELSYDSSPPDPDGVPIATRARYISDAMWRMWRVGIDTIIWFQMRDAAPKPSYASTYQSGIFYRDGRRKGDARAFRFPLLITGKSSKRLNVWFRTPAAGTVTVQVRRNGEWRSVAKVRKLPRDGVRTLKILRPNVTGVRGVAGKATSYVWDVG